MATGRQTPFRDDRPILVGMVHLEALPGSPGFEGNLTDILARAERDAAALVEGGADAIMLENFFDVPFFKSHVPRITIATMTRAAIAVKSVADGLPVGVNVLRNDARSALAIAVAAECDFIRVNVLCGARVTDQGVIEGVGAVLLRERAKLGPAPVGIWADVDVKHSAPLAERPIEDEVADTVIRGLADAVIVSGSGTGKSTDPRKVEQAKAASHGRPVLVGSGITPETVSDFPSADGLIAGTALKRDGRVDVDRVQALARAIQLRR